MNDDRTHFMHDRFAAKKTEAKASPPPRPAPFPEFIAFGPAKGTLVSAASLDALRAYEANLVELLAPGVREYKRRPNERHLRVVRRELDRRRLATNPPSRLST